MFFLCVTSVHIQYEQWWSIDWVKGDKLSGLRRSIDQSEASIQVTLPVLTNQRPVFTVFIHLISSDISRQEIQYPWWQVFTLVLLRTHQKTRRSILGSVFPKVRQTCDSICNPTAEGFLPSWNDSFHPGINPSRMEGILPGSYQNLGMTAIPKIQVQYL